MNELLTCLKCVYFYFLLNMYLLWIIELIVTASKLKNKEKKNKINYINNHYSCQFIPATLCL